MHEPELIILDEPTIGLDPRQIRAVRQLIKGLAAQHTVLISTHILPEAEMTCSRMVILYEGKILAADTPENLQRLMDSTSQVVAEIAAPEVELQECWAQMPEIEQFDVSPADGEYFRCALTPRDGMDLRPHDLRAGARAGLVLARADPQPAFAGGHLRPGDAAGRGGGSLMQATGRSIRRELAGFFLSLTGYMIIAGGDVS